MPLSDLAPVLVILFFSTLTRSTFGFGDALLAMPLLSMVSGIHFATPLVALVATTISIGILLTQWKKVDLASAWRLILSALVGIPIGLLYLKSLPEPLIKGILALVIFGFSLYNLVRPEMWHIRNERWAFLFGFAGGILGGAYNTNGPPVIIYGTLRKWKPENFRATLQGFFLPTGGMIMLGHALAGLWTREVLLGFATALPVVIAAIILGGFLHQRIPRKVFVPVIYILLMGISMLLGYSVLHS